MARWILIASAFVAAHGTTRSLLVRDVSTSEKERPVMKVVRLLQDMSVELHRELDDDKAVHEKLGCWCETNENDKTRAIDLGEAKIEQLSSSMDAATAKILELKEKRKATMEESERDQMALDKARALRLKETQAFHGEEVDLMEAIAACKQAVVVLSKHHPELAQVRSIAARLQDKRVAQLVLTSQRLKRDQLELLKGFLQQAAGASSFLSIPGFQSYAPRSGQIFGILKQMQKDFENSLSDAQRTDMKAKEDFEALQAAKEDEIASAKKAIVQIDADLAEFGEKHAQAAKEFEDTQAQLELDRTFLANLRKKCSESSEEYDSRVKSRLEELAAVEDTIKILNSDEAFESFDKSVNTALLQTSRVKVEVERKRRERAMSLLLEGAHRTGDPQLALIAASAQLDTFEKVKAEIDKLVAELGQQQKDEVVHRDWCIDELNENERSTAAADDKKEHLDTKKADLEKTVEQLSSDMEAAKAAIAEMQVQMKRASENREAGSADSQQTVTDQRLTQMILAKALDRMKQVYGFLQQQEDPAQPGAPHIQLSGNHTDPGNGPAAFKAYEKHAGGSRVVSLIEGVIADSRKTEDETIAAEEDAQAAYESFMKDSNKSIKRYMESLANMSEAKAKTKASLSMTETDIKQTIEQLEGLSGMGGDLHKSCDFLLQNFDARQEARKAEIDALREAKAVLSGMK